MRQKAGSARCQARKIVLREALGLLVLAFAAIPVGQAKSFDCLIEPDQVVEIRSEVQGIISKVYVKRGDRVKAGQVLVQLDSESERSAAEAARYRSQMQGRIDSAKHRLDYSKKKLARTNDLVRRHFVATEGRDQAEAENRIAESDLEDAKENQELARLEYQHNLDLLHERTLHSPFNGVVMDRMQNPGDLAEVGSTGSKAILKLAKVNPLRVEVVLPVALYGKLHVGDSGEVMPESLGGRYSAKITVVDSVLDSASATFGVRLELPNPKADKPAGVRCHVEFPRLSVAAARIESGKGRDGNVAYLSRFGHGESNKKGLASR